LSGSCEGGSPTYEEPSKDMCVNRSRLNEVKQVLTRWRVLGDVIKFSGYFSSIIWSF